MFSEVDVYRVSNGTMEDSDDLLVSYYAVYPASTFGDARVTVPIHVLVRALNENLATIVAANGVNTVIEGTFIFSL